MEAAEVREKMGKRKGEHEMEKKLNNGMETKLQKVLEMVGNIGRRRDWSNPNNYYCSLYDV